MLCDSKVFDFICKPNLPSVTMRFQPFHLYVTGYILSLKMRGYADFNEILRITEQKLTGKMKLNQGDTFTDLERWIFIDHIDESGLVHFLAGNPANERLQMYALPLDEILDMCCVSGIYEMHFMYQASNYNEIKSKHLTSDSNENSQS